jgi:hypothetical protein
MCLSKCNLHRRYFAVRRFNATKRSIIKLQAIARGVVGLCTDCLHIVYPVHLLNPADL